MARHICVDCAASSDPPRAPRAARMVVHARGAAPRTGGYTARLRRRVRRWYGSSAYTTSMPRSTPRCGRFRASTAPAGAVPPGCLIPIMITPAARGRRRAGPACGAWCAAPATAKCSAATPPSSCARWPTTSTIPRRHGCGGRHDATGLHRCADVGHCTDLSGTDRGHRVHRVGGAAMTATPRAAAVLLRKLDGWSTQLRTATGQCAFGTLSADTDGNGKRHRVEVLETVDSVLIRARHVDGRRWSRYGFAAAAHPAGRSTWLGGRVITASSRPARSPHGNSPRTQARRTPNPRWPRAPR